MANGQLDLADIATSFDGPATGSPGLAARPAVTHEALGVTLQVAARTTLVTLALTGLVYPLVMTAFGQTLFPQQASGSLIRDNRGAVVGSRLIGQAFSRPDYFQPRPSAAGTGFDAAASGGSNLGPSSARLRDRVKADASRLRKENPDAPASIPAELVTASGSGLDPHLSPAGVRWQISRVARARGVSPERIGQLVDDNIEGRDLGLFGQPRINVLELNLTLDRQFPQVH